MIVSFEPRDPKFEERIRQSFVQQKIMATLGASLDRIEPGGVDIALPYREDLVQQHGYLHAGVIATVLDSACGYAALSLAEPGVAVLAVEFKVNFLSPAEGERIVARGRVVRSGRTLTVCKGEAFAVAGGQEQHVASMLSTIIGVRDRGLVD